MLLVVSVKFFVKDAALYLFPIIGDMNSPIGAILDTFPGYVVGSPIGRFKYF
ncbi:hypothetical protein METP2_01665 [Methanosarcinales archaeon]|nr:hypothetical protein METP2_01665 [Methanosarcinales archaeon]